MPRMDSFGFLHPTLNDQATPEGYFHIAGCGQCRTDFPELGKLAQTFVDYVEDERRQRAVK